MANVKSTVMAPMRLLRRLSIARPRTVSQPETYTQLTSNCPDDSPPSNIREANIFPRALEPPEQCSDQCKKHDKVSCRRFCARCGHLEHVVVVGHDIATQAGSGTGLDGADRCMEKFKDDEGRWIVVGRCGDAGEVRKRLEFECLCCRRVWIAEACFRR